MDAVCFHCGEMKIEPMGTCSYCGKNPNNDEEMVLSVVLSDYFYSKETLEKMGDFIKLKCVPIVNAELFEDLIQPMRAMREKIYLRMLREMEIPKGDRFN